MRRFATLRAVPLALVALAAIATPVAAARPSDCALTLEVPRTSAYGDGTYARVPTLVAQRLRSETYESPALPLSYSATESVLRSTRGLSNEHSPRIPTVDNWGNS
jgi:hypothetical protein